MLKRSSGLMTFAGVLSAVSTGMLGMPFAVAQYYATIVKDGPPAWWLSCVFPMILFGMVGNMVGLAIIGVVGKGADDHSTIAQVQASTSTVTAQTPAAVDQAKVQVEQADAQAAKKP